jgi:hypothetical protein
MAFKDNFEELLGCNEPLCYVQLSFSEGSVQITARLIIPDGGAAAAITSNSVASAAVALASQSLTSLSASLGFSIESITPADVTRGVTVALPMAMKPPPATPPSPPPHVGQYVGQFFSAVSVSVGLIVGASVGGVSLLCGCGVLVWWLIRRRRRLTDKAPAVYTVNSTTTQATSAIEMVSAQAGGALGPESASKPDGDPSSRPTVADSMAAETKV